MAVGAHGGLRHYHLDHLGSVRLVTDTGKHTLGEHDYYPYGVTPTKAYQEELNPGTPHIDPMRYAGHQRDFLGYLNVENTDYLDYMHARYYDPKLGRFLSVDPKKNAQPSIPQSWNRYTYALNNPVKLIDPDGREWRKFAYDAGILLLINRIAVKTPNVRATLALYDGPDNPDLKFSVANIGGGHAGDRAGSFDLLKSPTFDDLTFDVSKMNQAGDEKELLPHTGRFLIGAANFPGGLLKLDDGLSLDVMNINKETARVLIHEKLAMLIWPYAIICFN